MTVGELILSFFLYIGMWRTKIVDTIRVVDTMSSLILVANILQRI